MLASFLHSVRGKISLILIPLLLLFIILLGFFFHRQKIQTRGIAAVDTCSGKCFNSSSSNPPFCDQTSAFPNHDPRGDQDCLNRNKGKGANAFCCLSGGKQGNATGGGSGNWCGACAPGGTCVLANQFCESQISCNKTTPVNTILQCDKKTMTWKSLRYNQVGGTCKGSCPVQALNAFPAALIPNATRCNKEKDNTYTCAIDLSETSSSQGNINWVAETTADVKGIIFNPAKGTMSPGQSTKILVSKIPCLSNIPLTFIKNASNSIVAATTIWTCGNQQAAPDKTYSVGCAGWDTGNSVCLFNPSTTNQCPSTHPDQIYTAKVGESNSCGKAALSFKIPQEANVTCCAYENVGACDTSLPANNSYCTDAPRCPTNFPVEKYTNTNNNPSKSCGSQPWIKKGVTYRCCTTQ